jgi:uncharacterized membrane protein
VRDAPVSHLGERVGWSLFWLAMVTMGVDAWGAWTTWPGLAFFTPLIVLAGLAGAVATWCVPDPGARWWQLGALASATATLGVVGGAGIAARQYYSTDSAAFNDVATRLLLHGHDPYTSSLRAARALLDPPSSYWTYLVNGEHVLRLSYPAGAFVLQAPLAALGVHHLTSDWLDLGAWIATVTLIFFLLPASLRWLAVLLALASAYALDFANGGTDALFVPFLVLAVWRWDDVAAARATRVARWTGPLALGVACSIKQSPWFCVPFLVVAVALESRTAGGRVLATTSRYVALVLAAFTLVNAPFIAWNPAAWWHGTMLPLLSPLVPDGQGLVTLALHGATRGADLHLLWLAAALTGLALVLSLALWYPRLKRAWVFLVPVVLFVPGRSLSNYLLDFFPVALVAATSVRAARGEPLAMARRARVALVGAPAFGAVAVAAWALASAPLQLTVEGVATSANGSRLDAVTVAVRNDAATATTPHFMLTLGGGHPDGFWHATVLRGRFPLAPGAGALVRITPATFTWAPQHLQYWLITAYSSAPAAVSTTAPQRWR